MESALFGLLNSLDVVYIISIPIFLYLLLRTEHNSRKRLDMIVAELKQANSLLVKQATTKVEHE